MNDKESQDDALLFVGFHSYSYLFRAELLNVRFVR
jgi:hypothetical protein